MIVRSREVQRSRQSRRKRNCEAFKAKGIPVGQVISSDYCRSWQTADLALGRHEKNLQLSLLPFEDCTGEQVKEMKKQITLFFVAKLATSENTTIVAHDDSFEATTGIHPDPMGIAYTITPDGNGEYTLVANVLPSEWKAL